MDELVKKLQACVDDPMWPHHAEVSKEILKEAVELLQARGAVRAVPIIEAESVGDTAWITTCPYCIRVIHIVKKS